VDPRAELVECVRGLLAAGLVRGTAGNASIRAGEQILLTPSALPYPAMRAEDIAVLEPGSGRQLAGAPPTTELGLHLAIYASRPDVAAIVHTHSTFATTFAVLGETIPAVHYQLARAGGPPAVADYARYGSPELAENCRRALGAGSAVLLANHGVVAVGTDLASAVAVAEALEFTAELAWRARLAGRPRILTEAELVEAERAFGQYRPPTAGRAEAE